MKNPRTDGAGVQGNVERPARHSQGTADPTSSITDDPKILAAAHAAAARLVRAARVVHGSVPTLGPEFVRAPWVAQAATLVVLGDAYLIRSPDQVAADQIKAAAVAISKGRDWSEFAWHHVSHGELLRRRYPPAGDPDLWVRWGPAGPPQGVV